MPLLLLTLLNFTHSSAYRRLSWQRQLAVPTPDQLRDLLRAKEQQLGAEEAVSAKMALQKSRFASEDSSLFRDAALTTASHSSIDRPSTALVCERAAAFDSKLARIGI